MDEDLALIISSTSIRSARQLGELMRIIPDGNVPLKSKIAHIIDDIYAGIVDEIYRAHPELKIAMDRRLAKYDRFI